MIVNESNAFYTDRIKEYTNTPDSNYLEYSLNKQLYNELKLKIKDIDKYDIKKIINDIKNGAKIKDFNEIRLYGCVRLEYYNSNNIIRKMMKFVEKFNKKISQSKVIVTALYKFYPELKIYKLFESEFTINLFENALKNCYFFPFHGKIDAITLKDSGTILFFIPNKTKIDEKETKFKIKKTYYLIGNLAVFIYIELHEVLGHYLRIILSKIIDYNYISPRYPYTDKNETGLFIEFLLFGKRVSLFSIKQLLYLLDVNNYNKELEIFKKEFNDVDLRPFSFSDELKNMLKEINIDLDVKIIDDDKTNLFRDKYILEDDSTIEAPFLNNCVENYELCQDEVLINLIKKSMKIDN